VNPVIGVLFGAEILFIYQKLEDVSYIKGKTLKGEIIASARNQAQKQVVRMTVTLKVINHLKTRTRGYLQNGTMIFILLEYLTHNSICFLIV